MPPIGQGCRIQHDERLRGQNGWRIHDHDVDACDIHESCTTVACDTRLHIGVVAFVWQLLSELELCRVSTVGACDEHPHFDDPGAKSTL